MKRNFTKEAEMSRPGYPKSEMSSERATGQFFYPNGSVFPYAIELPYTSMLADRVGANTPGWPHFKQDNPYSAFKDERKYSNAHFDSTNSSTGEHGVGDFPFSSLCRVTDPNSIWIDYANVADNYAHGMAMDKLIQRTKNQKINVMVAAAEFKKTCGTVMDACKRLAAAMLQVRKGHLGNASKILLGGGGGSKKGGKKDPRKPPSTPPPNSGSVARDWLAIQYGWRPLLSDIYGGCEQLANVIAKKPNACRVSSGPRGCEFDIPIDISPLNATAPPVKGRCFVHYVHRATIEYAVSDELAVLATNTGITNPAAVVWELVPYSFVVDWFLPVGSFLNNLDYANGLVFKRGWETVKAEVRLDIHGQDGLYISGPLSQRWNGGSLTQRVKGFRRELLGGFPDVRPPRFTDPYSLEHALNALALVRVAFSGGTKYK